MAITASMTLDVDGGTLTAPLKERTFSTGSTGFSGNGLKLNGTDGRRYQVSVNVVLIGSKPAVAPEAPTA
jgi:hypothetical protein